jgi:hypothetical protein
MRQPPSAVAAVPNPTVADRAAGTLRIMHRWGYAPNVEALELSLLGGIPPADELRRSLQDDLRFHLQDFFVALRGQEYLLQRSRERVASDRILNGDAWSVALRFASDLANHCPFVSCLAVSGSLASGGYCSEDDLDFDLVVRSGTKYVTYLLANLLGLKYSWKYRSRRLSRMHRVLSLPKLICINVVWAEGETKPFTRQDIDLAFELLRCRPILGSDSFARLCRENGWAGEFFPQLMTRKYGDSILPKPSALSRVLSALATRPPALRFLEVISRSLVWILYRAVQWSRRNEPAILERIRFLRAVKWPYEVLQD